MIEGVSSKDTARAPDLLEELVAIPSVTGEERPLLDFVAERCVPSGFSTEWIEVSPGRRNLFLRGGRAEVVLTTHADTVPPHVPARREGGLLYGRGACDAKASLAAMLTALHALASRGARAGLLVLVGEERGSDGAIAANLRPHPYARFLVGGEPTGSRYVAGCKGALRLTVRARGVAGHSSQEQGGRSAVPPLLDFLSDLRSSSFREDPVFGKTTVNIGVLEAGAAANVLAESARAEILLRTGLPGDEVLAALSAIAAGRVELEVGYRSDPARFRCPRGVAGEIVSYACDLPLLPAWGEPMLVGPGSILDAHTAGEKVSLEEVEDAVTLYVNLVGNLLARSEEYLEPRGAFMEHSRRQS
jgi:acetylornithine deacetylase